MSHAQSLGALLRKAPHAHHAKKPDASKLHLKEIHRRAGVVESFFEDVKKQLAHAIVRGKPIPKFLLGPGNNEEVSAIVQTWAWHDPEKSIVATSHVYYPYWWDFQNWAIHNELRASLRCETEVGSTEAVYALSVEPLL